LGIRPGWDFSKNQSMGIPYGTIPRLLLFWVTTEAVRTKKRRLELGNTLSSYAGARSDCSPPASASNTRCDRQQVLKECPGSIWLWHRKQSCGGVVYLVEKNRLPASAYNELRNALADPEYVIEEAPFTAEVVERCAKCHALTFRICRTALWRRQPCI
jgi:hypothetical protein